MRDDVDRYVTQRHRGRLLGYCLEPLQRIFTSPAAAVAKYCDEYVRLCVCLFARISPKSHEQSFRIFLRLLPMSVARSSSGMLTIGRIVYRREGVTGVHSAGEV